MLIPVEVGQAVPFDIKRVYTVFDTKPGVRRGFHAHHRLQQVAIAVAGSCRMVLDDGKARTTVILDRPDLALTLPPMVWHEMEDFSDNCVLLVLADDVYDENDYIRDYDAFLELSRARA
ncbi:dTDP-6-deoxy-3,4-keto-hexulose isomerase [Sphingomonas astaxanthinifaciens DSM 22298]|uniref:dTDP-6-deoxy-3,4-keto-hexulose isomerase n=1 Tax=Sphingomonas astaxanthinifaciens DSM 22298 TaxID=1123267 RepID=A0ABQ5Z4N7_9SPHN|nr:dTDP-6-deoxy-3,4-keto-hexulose isomerase [Sphingomonas astaxanthinifaciens DSM 22298]